VSFNLYIHPDIYMSIYIYWTECRITNEMTRSCVLCLCTGAYIQIYICLCTYIGLSVELQTKWRDRVCCVFPLVHTSASYMYIYIYIHTLGWECTIQNQTTRSYELCLSTCTYIRRYIYIHTYIGLSGELQMKPRDRVCCVFLFVHMGRLQSVGSLKLHVSLVKEPYKRGDILQKRPIILRSLPIEATPYTRIVYIYKAH